MYIIETNLQWREQLQTGNNPTLIVLHHADASSCTIYDIHQWHLNNGWSGCGYHFFVRKDGNIFRGRPENTIGAHTLGHNMNSLGICAEGNFELEYMPDVQKNSLIDLCEYLHNKYSITDIKRHSELFSTECPGRNYPFDYIKSSVLKGNQGPSISPVNSILSLQKNLNRLKIRDSNGNILSEDGVFGPLTRSSVIRFQNLENLSPDGIAGNITNGAIQQILSKPICTYGSNKIYSVRYIQWRIGAVVDGVFGDQTLSVVKKFQRIVNVKADGIVGPITWSKFIG